MNKLINFKITKKWYQYSCIRFKNINKVLKILAIINIMIF